MSGASLLTAAHMDPAAHACVRQPSELQVRGSAGRRRLQRSLEDHAKELAFRDVTVMDDGPGVSGDGVCSPGFEALPEAVCKGEVGLVLSTEASRLSRKRPGVARPAGLPRDRRLPGRRPGPAVRTGADRRPHAPRFKGRFNEMERALPPALAGEPNMAGDGIVEATSKVLVTQRLKVSSMTWSMSGGEAILSLRASVMSGRCDAAW